MKEQKKNEEEFDKEDWLYYSLLYNSIKANKKQKNDDMDEENEDVPERLLESPST